MKDLTGGEKDLATLLASMEPELVPGEWQFVSLATFPTEKLLLEAAAMVREREGYTLVMPAGDAQSLPLSGSEGGMYRCITLNVHSSLEAVGLTAAVSTALAAVGISANVVAGFYHDHFYVPADRAREAFKRISEISLR